MTTHTYFALGCRGAILVGGLAVATLAAAQIRTDGSLGGGARALNGPNYTIPQTLGRLVGSNLFHSFSVFNINSGESANFTTTSTGIGNVISRVTGGSPSLIYGPLSLTAASGAPNFYFINPAGVTFGAGSSIDVPAAFHVSTADYLKFPEGNFYADPARASTFSSVDPVAFGFLGNSRAPIIVKETILANPNGAMSFIAGDVSVDYAGLFTGSGNIHVAAVGAGALETTPGSALPNAAGSFQVINGAAIYTEATATAKGGNISLAAGNVGVSGGSLIETATATAQSAGAIRGDFASLDIDGRGVASLTGLLSLASLNDIGAGGNVTLSVSGGINIHGGGMIVSDAYGLGRAGNLSINAGWLALDGSGHDRGARVTNRTVDGGAGTLDIKTAGSVSLTNGSQISSDSYGSGQAGDIRISAGGDVNVLAGSVIASNAHAAGNAGGIGIVAANVKVDSSGSATESLTEISSQAVDDSRGNAGSIDIQASASVMLVNGGKILTSTNSVGQAGDVQVHAGRLFIEGGDYDGSTGIFSTSDFLGTGNAGTLNIVVVGDAELLRSGQVSTSTWGEGNGGKIAFRANNLTIDSRGNRNGLTGISSDSTFSSSGHGGAVEVEVNGKLRIADLGFISSSTSSSGNAGSVSIKAGSLSIDGGSLGLAGIESSSSLGGSGNAGKVSVAVNGDAELINYGYIRSDTKQSGQGGDLGIMVGGNLHLERGGVISSSTGDSGNAGNLAIQVGGELSVGGGGKIRSETGGSGNAGTVTINADRLTLDKGNTESWALILSDSYADGNAGFIKINARTGITLGDGGFISSDTYGRGNAGTVSLSAPTIRIGGDNPRIGAAVSSVAYGSGRAGKVTVSADNILLTGGDTTYQGGILSDSHGDGDAGSIEINARAGIALGDGAFITSDTYGRGNAGDVSVVSPSLYIGGGTPRIGAAVSSDTYGAGNAGKVTVSADHILLVGGDTFYPTGISSASYGNDSGNSGNAGSIEINASQNLVVANLGTISSTTYSNGHAGSIRIKVGDELKVVNAGRIASATFAEGDAGSIFINAGSLTVDGRGNGSFYTGITSQAVIGSSGNAGDVEVNTTGKLSVLNGGAIDTNTWGSGNAGLVRITAGSVLIDRGTPDIFAGISSSAAAGSSGNAGSVEVRSGGDIAILRGGSISSLTMSSGNAGSVQVAAGNLTIDRDTSTHVTGISSSAAAGSSGHAGNVDVSVSERLSLLRGGMIDSLTMESGNAGSVKVAAGAITIDRQDSDAITAITSQAVVGSSGNAGSVEVVAKGTLNIVNGGRIDSATYGAGAAGTVQVRAGDMVVDGRASYDNVASTINAFAATGSSGQTGQVAVSATRGIVVSNGGELSLRNDATVADPTRLIPTTLMVNAPAIRLDGGQITAAATGNVAASGIRIDFADRLVLDRGSITTSANAGNGGPISIQGGRLLDLNNAQITTSVLGLRGNGGDIRIGAQALAMNTGFIQANTAAANASGGNVRIDVAALLPSGSTLYVGGQIPYRFSPDVYGFNVIQAAAPTGVSGTVNVSAPVLDVSGSLVGLSTQVLDPGGLGRNPCRTPEGSSLAWSGRGYYPVQAGSVLDGELLAPPMRLKKHGVDGRRAAIQAGRECGGV